MVSWGMERVNAHCSYDITCAHSSKDSHSVLGAGKGLTLHQPRGRQRVNAPSGAEVISGRQSVHPAIGKSLTHFSHFGELVGGWRAVGVGGWGWGVGG